jgi:hypothetical protein
LREVERREGEERRCHATLVPERPLPIMTMSRREVGRWGVERKFWSG